MYDVIALWPQGLLTPDDRPTITHFPADPKLATGAAVVVLPGGGYGGTAPHEADPVAIWLNSIGIDAFVVHYRVAPHTNVYNPLNDAARAIRHARAGSEKFGVDPNRIGILGFSAGGHLAASISNHHDNGNAVSDDTVERVSSRPNLSILIYPVVSFKQPNVHEGSRDNLIGVDNRPEVQNALIEKFSIETQVTLNTPPAFLIHSADDGAVPVENSFEYASALRHAGVPVELHVFETGGHGYGLGGGDPVLSTWPSLCASWLARHGFARTP